MYNPDSREGTIGPEGEPNQAEWVEVFNAGDEAVSLAGHLLQDEDGRTTAIPANTTLVPGEAVVLIPGSQTVADFREAWDSEGLGFRVIPLDGWGMGEGTLDNLGNSPSERNEVLTLCDADGEVIDEVNYDDEGDWPGDSPDGASIALKPDHFSPQANDAGDAWALSAEGDPGVRQNQATDDYNGEDLGSPGVVAAE